MQAFASPPDEARRCSTTLGVTYVVTCGPRPPNGWPGRALRASLWGRLQADDVPDWLEPVAGTGAVRALPAESLERAMHDRCFRTMDDAYRKATAAGLAFLVCMEVMYFALSPAPSFSNSRRWTRSARPRSAATSSTSGWAAKSAFAGGPAVFFDFWNYNLYLQDYFGSADLHHYFWSYPPHILLFIWPFGLMPYLAAFALWSVMRLGRVPLGGGDRRGRAQASSVRRGRAGGRGQSVLIGQNGFFLAALLIGGLINLDRRPLLAGMLFGILTIKPQLGLLLPVMLVLTGRWRVIAAAAATTLVLVRRHLLALRHRRLARVPRQGRADAALPAGERSRHAAAADPLGVLCRAAGRASDPASTGSSRPWCRRPHWRRWSGPTGRPRDPVLSGALLVTATFLFSPYTLNYDFVVLAWVLALLRQRPRPCAARSCGHSGGLVAARDDDDRRPGPYPAWLPRARRRSPPGFCVHSPGRASAAAWSWNPFGWRIPAGAR